MEILALVPSLTDDFSTQPIFAREALGKPLEWTGALPPEHVTKLIDASLAGDMTLRAIAEGRAQPL